MTRTWTGWISARAATLRWARRKYRQPPYRSAPPATARPEISSGHTRGSRSCDRRGTLIVKTGRRQDGRTLRPFRALLHFNFGKQHGRSDRGNRHLPRFGPTDAIEYLFRVACEDDVVQGKKRSANNIHSPPHLMGTPTGETPPHHHRNYLECLWRGAARECEPALNIFEIE